MMLEELMSTARETLTVKRVYGEPYERDGVTILPAAIVSGGGGGGGGGAGDGSDDDGPEGEGGGFGLGIRPAGVYVIADGTVRWRPAVDVNRLIAAITAIAITGILAAMRSEQRRAVRRRR